MTQTPGERETRPLAGRRVLVTRAREQAGSLVAALRAAGAEPVEFPVIRIDPADDYSALDQALRQLHRYDWAVFTSANTVVHVERRLESLGLTWAGFQAVRVAAIGLKSADELRVRGVAVAYMPAEASGSALASGLPLSAGQRVLLPGANIADKRLAEGLRVRGAAVDECVAYQTTPLCESADALRARLAAGEIDAVTFASSSSVQNLCAALGDDPAGALAGAVLACIGPVTAETVRAYRLTPQVIAPEHTIEGLVAALGKFFTAISPS